MTQVAHDRPGTRRSVDLLVRDAIVITVDDERRVFADGAVAIAGGEIVAVGPTAEVIDAVEPTEEIRVPGKVVTPGFVQAHVHVSTEQAVRGIMPGTMPPSEWVRAIVPFYAATTEAEEELITTFTLCELLRGGTTCFIEAGTTKHTEVVADAVGRTGIRGCIGRWSWDIPDEPAVLRSTTDEAVDRMEDLIHRLDGAHDGRLRVWATPIGHTMTSDDLLVRFKEMADHHGVGVTMHLSSWIADVEGFLERTGNRPVVHLSELGVLGPNVVLAHMVNLDDHEVELVLETDTVIAHCSSTAGWFGYGLSHVAAFPEMLDRGATIALGCDAATCSNHLDVVRAMYTSAVLFRDARRDMGAMSAERAVEMATRHGARAALQGDDLGALEVGRRGDLVIFDTDAPGWRPMFDPVSNLVFSSSSPSVDTVVIEGQVVVDEGRVRTVDTDGLTDDIEHLGRHLLERLDWTARPGWPFVDRIT